MREVKLNDVVGFILTRDFEPSIKIGKVTKIDNNLISITRRTQSGRRSAVVRPIDEIITIHDLENYSEEV